MYVNLIDFICKLLVLSHKMRGQPAIYIFATRHEKSMALPGKSYVSVNFNAKPIIFGEFMEGRSPLDAVITRKKKKF